jgi:hypothetical protein
MERLSYRLWKQDRDGDLIGGMAAQTVADDTWQRTLR